MTVRAILRNEIPTWTCVLTSYNPPSTNCQCPLFSLFIFRSCTFIRCLPPLIRSLLWTRLWLCSLPNIWPVVCRLPSLVWNTFWIKIVFLIIDDGVARCRMFSTIAPSFISVRISIYSHRLMNNFFIKVKSSTFYKHLQHVKWKYYLVLVSYTALKRQMEN